MEGKIAMEALKKYIQMHEDALSAIKKEADSATTKEDTKRSARKVLEMQKGFAVEMGELLADIIAPGEMNNPLMFPLYYMMLDTMAKALKILMIDATSDMNESTVDKVLDTFWEGLDEGDH